MAQPQQPAPPGFKNINPAYNLAAYSDKYADFLHLTRTPTGVLTVQMHTDGSSHIMTGRSHQELAEAFYDIARDRENEVVILTGAGEWWMERIDFSTVNDITTPEGWFDITNETRKVLYNLLDIPVPVIAAVNGNAPIHGEYALLADVVLATDTTYFQDDQHLPIGEGVVPADGVQIIYPYFMGQKRGQYFLLTGTKITAQEALHIGFVNEVLPKDRLMARAIELGEQIVKINPITRRYTRLMFTKDLKQEIIKNIVSDMGSEGQSIRAGMTH